MCIRMIRYLTRFHCEKLRQCWKVKNAPATHTTHNVSQLSSLHTTHYKKKKKVLPLKSSRQILAFAATIFCSV